MYQKNNNTTYVPVSILSFFIRIKLLRSGIISQRISREYQYIYQCMIRGYVAML